MTTNENNGDQVTGGKLRHEVNNIKRTSRWVWCTQLLGKTLVRKPSYHYIETLYWMKQGIINLMKWWTWSRDSLTVTLLFLNSYWEFWIEYVDLSLSYLSNLRLRSCSNPDITLSSNYNLYIAKSKDILSCLPL